MKKDEKDFELSDVIGGTLNLLGLKIDMARLLSSPDDVRERLEELREKLKQAGGKAVLSDEEWRSGQASISGYFRTSGILGEREYHVGTAGPASKRKARQKPSEANESIEPPVDVFHEANEVVVVAEVPGVDLGDLELKAEGELFILSTKPAARRRYYKRVKLGSPVDDKTLEATCRNGVLEVHLQKKSN